MALRMPVSYDQTHLYPKQRNSQFKNSIHTLMKKVNLLDQRIKKYLQKIDPKVFGLNKIESIFIHKIGLGESNLN